MVKVWDRVFRFGRAKPDVLVVDDDDNIREVVRTILEGGSFGTIWEAESGEKAIEVADKEKPDLVVLDYMMPGMDGAAVARELGRLLPDARIVSFTAVLDDNPSWADAHVDKTQITSLAATLEREAEALNP